jgi:cysteinyl-tRNA synthetase
MSTKYLGQPFDIHGGGMDLIFPHHENEIAQSEAAFDIPFTRYWIHNELLQINQKKMSKSLGNFFTIQETLDRHEAVALRHYFLASHYRSPLDFSEEGLEEAESALARIYETLERVERSTGGPAAADASLLDEFRREMDDDFNTPRALALIHEEVRSLNRLLDQGDAGGLASRKAALDEIGKVLGIVEERPEAFLSRKKMRWLSKVGLSEAAVEALIRRRDEARREKKWAEADQIRSELRERGIALEDSPGGTLWKVQ